MDLSRSFQDYHSQASQRCQTPPAERSQGGRWGSREVGGTAGRKEVKKEEKREEGRTEGAELVF